MSPGAVAFHLGHSVDSPSWSPLLGLSASASMNPGAMGGEPQPSPKVDFNFQVRPILSDKCFNCHGPDPRQRKAGLRLDTKEGAFGDDRIGRPRHRAGQPRRERALIAGSPPRMRAERMPPKSLGRTLSPEEIDLLKRWIEQGAEWQAHWSFLPPVAAPAPDVKNAGWPRNPIDRFVLARLEAEDRTPAPEAEQGAADPPRHLRPHRAAPDARRDRCVPGRLGARTPMSAWSTACWPRRGSASEWPSTGSTWPATPTPTATRPTSIAPCGPGATGSIQAFNANLPYDRFITWQLAGDLLAAADPRPGPRHGVQPPPSPDQRGGKHRGRVPRRVRRRPDQHLRDRVPGADPRMRPLPQPQVRSDHPERVLSTVRLLQQHRRIGAVLALHRRRSDADPAA